MALQDPLDPQKGSVQRPYCLKNAQVAQFRQLALKS
jgi:hypothetical protein